MSSRLFYHSLYDNRSQLQMENVEVNVWACLLFGFFNFSWKRLCSWMCRKLIFRNKPSFAVLTDSEMTCCLLSLRETTTVRKTKSNCCGRGFRDWCRRKRERKLYKLYICQKVLAIKENQNALSPCLYVNRVIYEYLIRCQMLWIIC